MFLEPFSQTLCMKEMSAVGYFNHLCAHNRAEADHTISFPLFLLLCRQIARALLLLIDDIFAKNSWKVSLDFLIIEVIGILGPYTPTHHRTQRIYLLGRTSHFFDYADRNHYQPKE